MVAYVRTVKTSSGATAVQVVWSSRRGSRSIQHLGSAHDESELEALKAAARQRLVEGQGAFDLGLDSTEITGWPLEIVGSRAGHLWDALCRVYDLLGLDRAVGGDEVFRDLVLARIIEPSSKQDSSRVLLRPVSSRSLTELLRVACRCSPSPRCATRCRRRAPATAGWARRRWCSMT